MTRHKALFLDRDGVINYDHGYVSTKENFDFVEGIFELCRQASARGYLIIVTTNQSGIARGLYTLSEFLNLNEWMVEQFQKAGIDITATYYCPHLATGSVPEFTKTCDCRKPKPGMLLKAAQDHHIDLHKSIMIGDKTSDIIAAQAAEVGITILIADTPSDKVDHTVTNLNEISKIVFS